MAKLIQLEVSGIRSFNQHGAQQLKFSSPLTVILGQNGCGKTTIIESLLFATCGELPSFSNNGQGFVNDPNMTSSTMSKGYVKLKFTDQLENEIVIHRPVEVTKNPKSKALSFKSRPPALRAIDENGKEGNLAGRCADINKECCRLMNVSESVLANVIFCHQENSAWPLEERLKLKNRFDEIFDTDKYNKCVDLFKKQYKDYATKILLLKTELKCRQEKKEEVERDREKLVQKNNQLNQFVVDITAKQKDIEPINKRIQDICRLESDYAKLDKQLSAKEQVRKNLIEQQETILKNIGEDNYGTDEQLEQSINDFMEDERREKLAVEQLLSKEKELKDKARANDNLIESNQSTLGQYKNQQALQKKRYEKREDLVKKINVQMKLNINLPHDSSKACPEIVMQILKSYKDLQTSFKSSVEEKENQLKKMQHDIDVCRENFISMKEAGNTKQKNISDKEKQKEKIEMELGDLTNVDEDYNAILAKIQKFEEISNNLKSNFNESEEEKKVSKMKKEIQENEEQLNRYERDHRILQQNDTIEGKLESENKLISEKTKSMENLKSKHQTSLKTIFEKEIPAKRLKDNVGMIQNRETGKVNKLTVEINAKQTQLTRLKVEQENQRKKIEECKEKLLKKQSKIDEVCNGNDFQTVLDEAYQKKDKLQRQKGQHNSTRVIFTEFIKDFEKENPCCPVCETKFGKTDPLVRKISKSLRFKLSDIPNQLALVEDELKEAEERYNSLLQLQPLIEEIQTISEAELPLLEDQLIQLDEELASTTSELNLLQSRIEQPQKIVDICKNIITDVAQIDQNQIDVEKAKQNVRSLENQKLKLDSMKSKFEIEAEIDTLKSSISDMRQKIEEVNKAIKNHNDRLQQITQQKSQLQHRQVELKEKIQRRPMLQQQTVELSEEIEKLNQELEDMQMCLSSAEAELNDMKKNKETTEKEYKKAIESERAKLMEKKQIISDIENVELEIEDYLKKAIDDKLKSTENLLNDLKTKSENYSVSLKKIQDKVAETKEKWAKSEMTMRNMKDAKLLRVKQKDQREIEAEIKELATQTAGFNYVSLNKEKFELNQQRDLIQRQINNVEGKMSELRQTIDELEEELNLPINRDAVKSWRSKKYEVAIYDKASEDLMKFITAFEQSIIVFHRQKMIQVNKIIRELWRDIYRGNDIDFIEIKAEMAGAKKGYEYKVIQNKGGVELDMRGRCSAGQKILASLIIRIALAESLSFNCGILALDEPTTNLDKENINSLSYALAAIIQARQEQKNFQLLLITHDEEFIDILNRAIGIPYYYKVSRDPKGFSVINKQYTR